MTDTPSDPATEAADLRRARLWYIDGRAYDLAAFVRKHPGGSNAILLGRGTNCTELFRTYHFMRTAPALMLAKYEVAVDRADPRNIELLGDSGYTFADGDFYKTVAARVVTYFRETRQKTGATFGWQVFAALSILASIALTYPAFVLGSLWATLALGFMRAMASVGAGHSMSHFSVFPRGRWNTLVFRIASPFMVSSWAIWSASHVRSHHVDTLTADDLQDNYPLKRVQPAMPHCVWHRGQHFYIWLIYLLGLPLWALQDFLLSILSLFGRVHMETHFSLRQRAENALGIGFNLLFSVALPFVFLDWPHALLLTLIANAASSLLVVVQIVVNHEVPETVRNMAAGQKRDWGAHQVLTSHNYGIDSALALHLSGGLNMQIEHHLFPSVHYTHYPALRPIVQAACVEFGLPYQASATVWEAIGKHYRILKLNSVP